MGVKVKDVSNCWTGIWNGTISVRMQLWLTCVNGTVHSSLNYQYGSRALISL